MQHYLKTIEDLFPKETITRAYAGSLNLDSQKATTYRWNISPEMPEDFLEGCRMLKSRHRKVQLEVIQRSSKAGIR